VVAQAELATADMSEPVVENIEEPRVLALQGRQPRSKVAIAVGLPYTTGVVEAVAPGVTASLEWVVELVRVLEPELERLQLLSSARGWKDRLGC